MELLARGDYLAVELLTQGERLSVGEIAEAITSYGRTVVVPPPGAFRNLDIVEVTGASPRTWSVNVPLWTAEEGRSDLTAEFTIKSDGEDVTVELDDIHVL